MANKDNSRTEQSLMLALVYDLADFGDPSLVATVLKLFEMSNVFGFHRADVFVLKKLQELQLSKDIYKKWKVL